jgi:aryl-phospho-beta-D-glucosidase BglC (GH1 family)
MMKSYISATILSCIMVIGLVTDVPAQMTPQEAILKMTCGINIGRHLENSTEGEGKRFVQEYYFEDFKAAGFNFVRIPVQWDQHTGTAAPYTIDPSWLNRVEQVVDWSLKHGLITFINSHHDRWILEDPNYTTQEKDRFVAIWTQVAEHFKDKSDSLFFEIANEPTTLSITQVNTLNSLVIPVIRATNPTRIIIYSGNSYTGVSHMKAAAIPNDDYIMATFHSYDPWPFAGEGVGTWGTTSEINAVKVRMADAASWSSSNNIPVILGEFGTVGKCDATSRMKWFYTYLEEARRKNIAPAVWTDFGDFGVYYINSNPASKWNTVIKDIIVYTHYLSTESLKATDASELNTQLTWKNRAADYKWIRIERKLGSGSYSSLANLEGSATTYTDPTTISGKTYTYRVVCELSTGEITYSYPADVKVVRPTAIGEFAIAGESIEIVACFKDGMLNINTELTQPDYSFTLYTLSGQKIFSGRLLTNRYVVPIANMSSGIYLITVKNSNGQARTVKAVNN